MNNCPPLTPFLIHYFHRLFSTYLDQIDLGTSIVITRYSQDEQTLLRSIQSNSLSVSLHSLVSLVRIGSLHSGHFN